MPDPSPDAAPKSQELPYVPKAKWTRVDYHSGAPAVPQISESSIQGLMESSVRPLPEDSHDPLPDNFKEDFIDVSSALLAIDPESALRDLELLETELKMRSTQLEGQIPENTMLGTVIGGIQHDIGKQVANVITGCSNLIKYESVSDELRQSLVRMIKNGIINAKTAVNSWGPLVAFIDDGTIQYSDARGTHQRFIEIASGRVGDINLSQLMNIRLPVGPLEVILGNLVINTKGIAGPSAPFYWGIGVDRVSGSTTLVLRIWDKAGGFSDSFLDPKTGLPKIGETRREGGTGKGLELVDTMADLLGAKVEVGNWSDKGEKKGAVFTIRVPLQEVKPS